MKKFNSIMIVFFLLVIVQSVFSQTTKTVGTSGADYTTLKDAFTAINSGSVTGQIILQIIDNTTETSAATLNASGSGSANYSYVLIYPTVSGKSITGSLATPLIDLNGADNVTIDGRVNQTGNADLIISNTSTSNTTGTSTIRFINDAMSNTIRYCNLKGSSTTVYGIITFSTGTSLGGNDNNTITYNNITCASDANRPVCAVGSSGTATFTNSGNTISNNNIYDFFNRGTASFGINLYENNTAWSIMGNSFYETQSFEPTYNVNYKVINISYVSGSGINFVVSNNFIGGNSAGCGGNPWTKTGNTLNCTNNFTGIYVKVGTGTASSIQGNTIKNFSYASYPGAGTDFSGIEIAGGDVNVGNTTGNTIGSGSGTGSIVIFGGSAGNFFYGIKISAGTTINCTNNIIGSISLSDNSGTGAGSISFYGIMNSGTGTTSVSNNTIGSTSSSNSIYASSPAASLQNVYGIYNAGSSTVTISSNTISNMTNGTTNSSTSTYSQISGIYCSNGSNTVTNNNVYNLSIANANNATDYRASVVGIDLIWTTSGTHNITGNTIYNLSNTNASYTGNVIGLSYSAFTSPSTISRNFIHSLSVNSSTTSAGIYGIKADAGAATYSNNIISLGGNTVSTLYGMFETGAASNNNNLYFNTIYISGSPASGALNSYAFYSSASTNTRNFRNNIFVNSRSNNGASGSHYALYVWTAGGTITCDYNDYYVSGSGGILGYYAANKTSLPIVSSNDVNSYNENPNFASPGGTSASNYLPSAGYLVATTGTGITTDYNGSVTRSTTLPSVGAFEYIVNGRVTVTATLGTTAGNYLSLNSAFAAINAGTHKGVINITLQGSTYEGVNAVIYQSGYNATSSYTSINIYPTVSGVSINNGASSIVTPLINLNGADNITIDGRVNAAGSIKDLVINSQGTAINYINDATSNTVKYCTVKGKATAEGIIYFGTGTTTGNDGNIIDNNDITSYSTSTRTTYAINSFGTTAKENSEITISNNNIYDVLSKSIASYCIYAQYYNTNWTITGNSFYETSTFTPTASVASYAINMAQGTGYHTITGNYIGGSSPNCGGTWTKTGEFDNVFYGIYLNVGTATATSVQGNTIKGFNYTNSSTGAWYGIYSAAGLVNIGNTTGNTIGASTGTGSITYTGGGNGSYLYGVYASSTGTLNISNNTIGSITAGNSNSTYATNIIGICKSISAGSTTISNNVIGSTSTANSINASSTSTASIQTVYGISCSGTATGIIVSGNTISNLLNNSTYATSGIIAGIFNSSNYSSTITGNFISSLSANESSTYTSIYGIQISAGSATGTSTYSNNIITLGGNSTSIIYGIFETGDVSRHSNLYYNTVYIYGTPTSGTLSSYALYSAVNTNTRNFRNNILVNARSNNGAASGNHFGLYVLTTGGTITCDYNDYYITGTGGILGYYGGNITSLPIVTNNDANSLGNNPNFATAGGTAPANYLPSNLSLTAITGTGVTVDFSGTTRSTSVPSMGAYEYTVNGKVAITATSGTLSGQFMTLKGAIDAINAGTHKGTISIVLNANVTESAASVLYQSGYGAVSSYTSIVIYPSTTGVTISGSVAADLIDLNNADNVTIDGRVNQAGSTPSLTIQNTSSSGTAVIGLLNDATSNTLKYLNIKGATTYIVNFSTTTNTTGNDDNILEYCNLTNYGGTRQTSAVFSLGTSAKENSGNIIRNNNFYDFFKTGVSSYGIYLQDYNTAWSISGNSFYGTTTFATTSHNLSYYFININYTNFAGKNYTISGNYIGGSSAECGGTAWTKSSAYTNTIYGIYVKAGTGTGNETNIDGNVIRNISWSCASSANGVGDFYGINLMNGDFNIGKTTGNTIGASTGTGSISLDLTRFTGISSSSLTGVFDCRNNTIGSITTSSSTDNTKSAWIYGISSGAPNSTITGNNIGSTSTPNSLYAASPSTGLYQDVYGIYASGSGNQSITNNTISNLRNGTTFSHASLGSIMGLKTTAGCNIITGNTIYNLSSSILQTAPYGAASLLSGIYNQSTTGTLSNVSGNIVHDITALNTTFAGSITGIGNNNTSATPISTVSKNLVYNLSVSGASSTTAQIFGIYLYSGTNTASNNIVTLGGNTATTLFGMYVDNTGTHNLYFNTVYIGGSAPSGATNISTSLYNFYRSTQTLNFRDNILMNARSTSGGSNLHFAMYVSPSTNGGSLTTDYNDYYVTGVGGALGSFNGSVKTSLPIVSGQDANSINTDPYFVNAGGTNASDYIPDFLLGYSISEITTDYQNLTRYSTPTMGSFESGNIWLGGNSTDWNTGSNWYGGSVPRTNTSVMIPSSGVVKNCILPSNITIRNLFHNNSSYVLNTNGYNMSITGAATFTNGASITSAAGSVTFQGNSAQTIFASGFPAGINNLVINNTNGVTLNGNLTVNNSLTFTNGKITLGSNDITVNGNVTGGSSTNYIVANSTGSVKSNIPNSGSQLLPVGNTSYNPVTITNNTGSSDAFSVRVIDAVYDGGSSGNPFTSNTVNRTWDVSKTNPNSGSGIDMVFQWNDTDEQSGFNRSAHSISHFENGTWYEKTGSLIASGNNPYSASISGYTGTFSPFALGNYNGPLPVKLSSFLSSVDNHDVKLKWKTSVEMNNYGFDVERKSPNSSWSKIGFIQGKGNSNIEIEYSFFDRKLASGKYQYRLKQIDYNSNFEYFALNGSVEIGFPAKFDLSQNYPNPFNPITKIDFQLPIDSKVSIVIYDITGREVKVMMNNEFRKADYYTLQFNAGNLSSGVYFYRIVTDKFIMTKKMVLVK